MENRLKSPRREFIAAACAFGAVSLVPGAGAAISPHPSIGVDGHLTVLLSGVRMDGLAAALNDRDGVLSRRIASILAMRPLPRRCIVLPECSCAAAADGMAALRSAFAACGVEAVMAGKDVVRVVDAADCDILLLDDREGSLAASVQDWLAAELPRWKRPVFICAKHPPEWMCGGRMASLTVNGRKFGDFLGDVPHLAGYLHWHGHRWQPTCERTGNGKSVSMLALPSVASWGDIGHVILRTGPGGAVAELRQDGFHGRQCVEQGRIRADWRSMVAANRGATCTFGWNAI